MTQYYPNSTGYVMHAYRKDTNDHTTRILVNCPKFAKETS